MCLHGTGTSALKLNRREPHGLEQIWIFKRVFIFPYKHDTRFSAQSEKKHLYLKNTRPSIKRALKAINASFTFGARPKLNGLKNQNSKGLLVLKTKVNQNQNYQLQLHFFQDLHEGERCKLLQMLISNAGLLLNTLLACHALVAKS